MARSLRRPPRMPSPAQQVGAGARVADRVQPAPGREGRARTAQVHGVRITHADRVMYPDVGLTKEDIAKYYDAVGPWMAPEVRGRPLTVVRCPNGAQAPCVLMRHMHVCGPPSLRRVRIREKTKSADYLVADAADALIGLAQMDVLEVH